MRVHKCDRCGREFGRLNGILFAVCGFATKSYIDLCPECLKSFKEWLQAPKLLRKRCEMASTVKRTIWLVTDHGGEWEDMWDWDIRAFTDEKAARECAEKRKERRKRTMDEFDDYWGTDVKRVTLIESGEL